jgi:type III secretion protein L
MSFLAVHVDEQLALSTDAVLIPPDQVRAFADALALAEAMCTARDAQAVRLAAAREAGYAEGRAQGLLEGRREAHTGAAEQLADTLTQLHTEQHSQQADLRAAVLNLSLLLVRRVAATLDREDLLAALIAQAFDRLFADEASGRGAVPFAIRLHPQLLGAVQRRFQSQTHGRAPALAIEWRADAALAPLDCIVETAAGRVLVGLDAQLERIRAVLNEPQHEQHQPSASPLDAALEHASS